jgi:hypothetical protein
MRGGSEMGNGGITFDLKQIIALCLILAGGFGGNIYTAFAQQSNKDAIVEIKAQREKDHEKYDKKFAEFLAAAAATNLRLERIATQLEERTK